MRVQASGSVSWPHAPTVMPALNEARNLPHVDDSDDQTPAVVAVAAKTCAVPVRLLHRTRGKRLGGLGGTVQAGLAAVTVPWTVVMDGDLQHPQEQVSGRITAMSRART